MKKLTLTSIIGLMVVMPAVAAVGDRNFTADNTTEAGVCVVGVTGADTGSASATAQWSTNSYTCAAGTYLPNGNSWSSDNQYTDNNCAQCVAGNYCVGSASSSDATAGKYVYDATTTKGTQSCPSGFPSSDAGSDAQSDCYRTCTTDDVAHSANVTGRFYSDDTNACEPTSTNGCVMGYHYVAGFNASTSLPATGTGAPAGTAYVAKNNGGNYCNQDEHCMEDEEWDASDLASMQALGLNNNEWHVTYGSGSVQGELRGIARCSTQRGTGLWDGASGPSDVTTRATLTDETGQNAAQYCYCQPTGWKASGGALQSLSAPWVFLDNIGDADICADICAPYCADTCASDLQIEDASALAFRSAVFGSIQSSGLASCQANEITINWGGYGANNTESESTSCTYDGAITTPTTAPTKRGHTFTGWHFVAQGAK